MNPPLIQYSHLRSLHSNDGNTFSGVPQKVTETVHFYVFLMLSDVPPSPGSGLGRVRRWDKSLKYKVLTFFIWRYHIFGGSDTYRNNIGVFDSVQRIHNVLHHVIITLCHYYVMSLFTFSVLLFGGSFLCPLIEILDPYPFQRRDLIRDWHFPFK